MINERETWNRGMSGALMLTFASLGLVALLVVTVSCADRAGMPAASTPEELRARIEESYNKYRGEFPEIGEITAEELAVLAREQEVIIVDVREPEEQAVSMIPGALTQQEFEARFAELRGKPVVAHCTIGYRSGLYTEELEAKGVDAKNLAGSILAWVAAGEPVVDKTGRETKRVHVYGPDWNLLPEGYEAVW